MLAVSVELPLGFVAIVQPADLEREDSTDVAVKVAPVMGDGWGYNANVGAGTLQPVAYERAAGLLDRWRNTGADVALATAGYATE